MVLIPPDIRPFSQSPGLPFDHVVHVQKDHFLGILCLLNRCKFYGRTIKFAKHIIEVKQFERDSELSTLYASLAFAFTIIGRYAEAEEAVHQTITILERGIQHRESGGGNLVHINGILLNCHLCLAETLVHRHQQKAAEQALEKAVSISSSFPELVGLFGSSITIVTTKVLEQQGYFKEALEVYIRRDLGFQVPCLSCSPAS